jgi:hypothetical protein
VADLAGIRRDHVLRAVTELTELADLDGEGGTVATPDTAYRMERNSRRYDVIEVVDRALWLASGEDMADELDPPDARDCALLLRGLGFDVLGEGLPPVRYTSAATVGAEHSHATWALAARERLTEVAAVYGSSIGYRDLADFVQRRSQVRTTAHARTWIGDVLARVAEECSRRREPLLTSLVVDAQGKVGASYATALSSLRGDEPADLDAQAAQERLDCHRAFGAELPPDGGSPVVLRPTAAPRVARVRATSAKAGATSSTGPSTRARSKPEPAPKRARAAAGRRTAEENVVASDATTTRTCPVHFTVLPPSGVCDYCD